MAKMRAVQIAQANGPFEIVEREIPQPGVGEVRIKVQACGICHSDFLTKKVAGRASVIRACPGTRSQASSMT